MRITKTEEKRDGYRQKFKTFNLYFGFGASLLTFGIPLGNLFWSTQKAHQIEKIKNHCETIISSQEARLESIKAQKKSDLLALEYKKPFRFYRIGQAEEIAILDKKYAPQLNECQQKINAYKETLKQALEAEEKLNTNSLKTNIATIFNKKEND